MYLNQVCLLRVAKEEKHNKMSPNALAIVFAPCVLRSPDVDNPFLGMHDVSKTTMWVFFFSLKKQHRQNAASVLVRCM